MLPRKPDSLWPKQRKAPAVYIDCFRRALRRMAVLLNSGRAAPCSRTWLAGDDQTIQRNFEERKLDALLVRLGRTLPDRNVKDEEAAEKYFYGAFQFTREEDPSRVVIDFNTRKAFVDLSYEGLELPPRHERDLQGGAFTDLDALVQACATNYLLKNFWHNFVHDQLQTITHGNYHMFRRQAREESDFEADNVANVLLALSYGHGINTAGTRRHPARDAVSDTFRRNRCNTVFALRAALRRKAPIGHPTLEDWQEVEWRYRRSVSNQISAGLVERGYAIGSIGVYFTGPLKTGDRGFYRKGEVAVQLNGRWIHVPVVPYLRVSEDKDKKADVANAVDRTRAERQGKTVDHAITIYTRMVDLEGDLRRHAAHSLEQKLLRVGIRLG